MKKRLLLPVTMLCAASAFAQIDFAPHSISQDSKNANMVHAADMDGDGDMDIITSSGSQNILSWYENLDGKGAFATKRIITEQAETPYSLYAADIDNNGTMDVLSASGLDDKIAW